MSITIYSPLGATEKAYAISILYNGVYAGSPTDLGGLIGLKPVTMLSFIDANDISQNDWLGKIVSGTLTESLKAIYQDLDPTYAGLANIFVAAVLYNSGTPNWSLALAKSYVQTNAGIHYDDQAYPNDYLPFAILHTAIWAGSMAQNFRSGWTGSNPATPTGPFTYIICQQGASTNYYVADKLHRASTYNGDDTYAPTTDMVTMNWNGGTPGSFAEMRSFLSHRLSEHQQAPVMTTSPRKQDNLASPGNYPHIKKSASSQIIFSFSEKAIGAGATGNYAFATPPANITMPSSSQPAKTTTVPPVWGNGSKETHTLQFDSTGILNGTQDAVTLAAAVTDASKDSFATDAQFIFDSGSDTPVVEIEIVGPVSDPTTYRLTDSIDPPMVSWASFTLNVRVKTSYPSSVQPTASLIAPAALGGTKSLPFSDHAASYAVVGAPNGVYTVLVDNYANNAGALAGPLARSFIVAASVSSVVGSAEGASYYPREEQAPSASDPVWTATVLGATEQISAAGQLAIQAGGTAYRFYSRTYSQSYGTGPTPVRFPGSALSYVEACLRANLVTPNYAGAKVQGFDQAGNTVWILDSGIGMELVNGPFRAVLRLVEASTDGSTNWRKTFGLRLYDEARNVWALEPGTIDLTTADTIVRMSCVRVAGGYLQYRIQYKLVGGNWAGGVGCKAVLGELPIVGHETSSFSSCSVSFGRFQPAGSPYTTADSNWEYVRYGFIDERFSASLFNPNTIMGIPSGQRAGDPNYRRSPDIMIGTGATASTDELVVGPNSIKVNIRCGVLPLSVSVPYKLRLFMADWDEADFVNAPIAGFTLAGLPAYPFPAVGSNSFIGKSTGTVLAGSTVSSNAVAYTFNPHRLDRLHRRLFLFAAIDSPLLPEPLFLPAAVTSSMLPADAGRTDLRYAARQFLPDFYVRDTDTDYGQSPGGSLSPDIALAIFKLDATGTWTNPQSTDTANMRFPSGFAQGQPATYNYNPSGYVLIDSTDSAKQIKITDSGWSDCPPDLYCNRMWVRLSNRGVVPGPANVQLFFLGSALRTMFNPGSARTNEYEKIYAQLPIAPAIYVQKKFQAYNPATGAMQSALVDAIPALSGASASDMPSTAYRFVIAEFVWHVSTAAGISSDDAHGCRAACVNLTDPTHPEWSSGIDGAAQLNPANSVWDATAGSNNISVRNSNIVQGSPSGAADPPYNALALIIDNSPVNYMKMPNDFRMSFSKKHAIWGILIQARAFPSGDIVIRLPSVLVRQDTKWVGMDEVKSGQQDKNKLVEGEKPPFRFFQLRRGGSGIIENLNSEGDEQPKVSLFFQPHPLAKPGRYEVTLAQTADSKPVGEYRTVIMIPMNKDILYVADGRTGVIYDLTRYPWARDAIPYEQRAIFTGAGLAIQNGYRLGAQDAVDAIIGKLDIEIVNLPRKYKYPPVPSVIPALHGGLEGAVIGRVLVPKGVFYHEFEVILRDKKFNRELARAVTDRSGRYLLKIEAKGETIPTKQGTRNVELSVRDRKSGVEKARVGLTAPDLCFGVKEILAKP